MLGGEKQRGKPNKFTGYSKTAQCTGNGNSMQTSTSTYARALYKGGYRKKSHNRRRNTQKNTANLSIGFYAPLKVLR